MLLNVKLNFLENDYFTTLEIIGLRGSPCWKVFVNQGVGGSKLDIVESNIEIH